jgi:hypothetical protein
VSRDRTFALATAAGLITLTVAFFAWDQLSGSSAERPPIVARTDLAPRTLFFGDTVSAFVDVTLDRNRVDPDSVRIEADFAPWKVVASPERVRRDDGATTSLRFSYVLRCLGTRCISTEESRVILDKAIHTFGQARVTYSAPEGSVSSGRESLRTPWPRLLVGARFSARDAQAAGTSSSGWRAELESMPSVTYRIPPGVLVALLLAGGAVLAAVGGALVYRARARRTPALPDPGPSEPVLTPLERALALLEISQRVDGAADQRRALELVAAALARHGDAKLALASRALAWSRPVPAVEQTNGMAVRARSALSNGAP